MEAPTALSEAEIIQGGLVSHSSEAAASQRDAAADSHNSYEGSPVSVGILYIDCNLLKKSFCCLWNV